MPAPFLHIVQSELTQQRTHQLLQSLGETDIVVLLHKQARVIRVLESVPCGPVYAISDTKSAEDSMFPVINHAEFIELIAHCVQSRTW